MSTDKDLSLPFRYPITRIELAAVYGVDRRTIYDWLREIEVCHGKTLSPAELVQLVARKGAPIRKSAERVGVQIRIWQ